MININRPIIPNRAGDSCGPACWHAKLPVCRCCCGGVNHGKADPEVRTGTLPYRTRRVRDRWFYLAAAGSYSEAAQACKALARFLQSPYDREPWQPRIGHPRDFLLRAGIIVHRANESQRTWPELADYMGDGHPWLLWAECSS